MVSGGWQKRRCVGHACQLCRDILIQSVLHREIPLYIHTGQLYMEDGIEVEKKDDDECIIEDGTGTASNDTGTGT